MTQPDALRLIKALRDCLFDEDEEAAWVDRVVDHLDRAMDVIEFTSKGERK